jgi:hypothetical protein
VERNPEPVNSAAACFHTDTAFDTSSRPVDSTERNHGHFCGLERLFGTKRAWSLRAPIGLEPKLLLSGRVITPRLQLAKSEEFK